MRNLFMLLLLLLTICLGCKSKQNSVFGIWKNKDNATLEISEYGKGVKIIHTDAINTTSSQIFTGTFDKDVLTINSGNSGNLTIPINDKKLIFNGKEYSQIAEASEMSPSTSLNQLSKKIVEAVKRKTPELLKTNYPDEEFYDAIRQKCAGGNNMQFSANRDYLRSVEDLNKEFNRSSLSYADLSFESFQTSPLKQLRFYGYDLTCNNFYKELGQLQITCKHGNSTFFIFVPCYLISDVGNVYIVSPVQISASGEPLSDRIESMKSKSDELMQKEYEKKVTDSIRKAFIADSIKNLQ
jgi:hypothetical protein